MVSGGDVCVPAGAAADSLTTEDGEVQEDGHYNRQYFFGGTAVGTAVMEDAHEDTNSFDQESKQNIQAARDFSSDRDNTPYMIIGAAGLIFCLLILWRIIKVAKS